MPTLLRHGCLPMPDGPWLNEIWKLEDFHFWTHKHHSLDCNWWRCATPQAAGCQRICRHRRHCRISVFVAGLCRHWEVSPQRAVEHKGINVIFLESAASEFHGPSSTPNVKFVWALLKSGQQVPWKTGEKHFTVWCDMILWCQMYYTKNLRLVYVEAGSNRLCIPVVVASRCWVSFRRCTWARISNISSAMMTPAKWHSLKLCHVVVLYIFFCGI